jgi:ABC-type uncharacterized transport system ATPase subunit
VSAIEARRLTKIYRTYQKESGLRGSIKGLVRRKYEEIRAPNDVSFTIEEGELVRFLGPNGAGKTTVLRMLSGLLNPTSGDARVLGFVPWERRNEMKRQFSLLIHEPRLLFLGEPTIGLDVVSQKRGREFLRLSNSEHRIVTMLTSHYMQDIEELCDRVILIDHGKIFFDGPLNSIIDRFSGYKIISLMFQDANERDFSSLGEVVAQTPISVQWHVTRARVTEACGHVLEGCAVIDINVQELPVEEIIRQPFGERSALRESGETAVSAHAKG